MILSSVSECVHVCMCACVLCHLFVHVHTCMKMRGAHIPQITGLLDCANGVIALSTEEPTTVIVPQPDLVGTNKEYSNEAVQRRISEKAQELRNDDSLTEEEREQKLKDEKMRIGIEKMRLAHKKRVAIKVFNPDRSNKTVVVEEGMTAGMVCHLLVVKNHFDESPNWVLVEQLGDVSLEREIEDHESVVEVYSSWPREHNNVFLFKQNEKKYDLFEDPIVSHDAQCCTCTIYAFCSLRNIFLTICDRLKHQPPTRTLYRGRRKHARFSCKSTSPPHHVFLN